MSAQKGDAQLSCGCVRTYEPLPKLHDTVICPAHHNTPVEVVGLVDRSWKAKCLHCRFSRYGEEGPMVKASERHTLGAPDHQVELSHDGELKRVIDLEGGQTFDGMGRSVAAALTVDTEPEIPF